MSYDSFPSCSDPLAVHLQTGSRTHSVWADILTPAAKAALLASTALAGIGGATAPQAAQAQTQISFDSGTPLSTEVANAASSVGDFDGDDDLDLLVTGNNDADTTATIYENTGQNAGSGSLDENTFQTVGAGLVDVADGASAVGDLDGDGDLDLVLSGVTSAGIDTTIIYENTGQNGGDGALDGSTFQEVGAGLTDVRGGAITAADFDGDNDLDLLVTGGNYYSTSPAKIYENTGQNGGSGTLDGNTFQEINAGLTDVARSSNGVGDFDGDGDLDLLITGLVSYANSATAKVYENTGQNEGSGTLDGNTFQEVGAGLTGVNYGSEAIGDFDGDGDLDLLINGATDFYTLSRTAKVYENTGQNEGGGTLDGDTFQEVGAGLTGVEFSANSAGDFDGDGDLDLLVTGSDGSNATATIYENTGQNEGSGTLDGSTFQSANEGITGVSNGASSVGDLDGDLDLDLLVTGGSNSDTTATFYDNTSDNPIPVELTDFTVQRDGQAALLSWRTASEQNNAGFEVQRLVGTPGSGTYESVGFVDGAGTTDRPRTYRFRTDDLRVGTHHFRLKQIDTDGSVEYSETVPLKITLAETYRLSAPTPNPVAQETKVRLAVEQTQAVTVSVYDLMGREVATVFDRTLSAQSERSIRVTTEDLPAGTYFLRVDGERFTATERLTVVE